MVEAKWNWSENSYIYIAIGSSLIYLITPSPNLAFQRRQRFRGKPFVNLLRVYSTRHIHENVECTATEKRGKGRERERERKRERERERERERYGVPAKRTRDRPIIDVPYRCVAPSITSTKTVPNRTSIGTSLQRPFPLFLSSPPCTLAFPYRSPFGQLRTFLAFSSQEKCFAAKHP